MEEKGCENQSKNATKLCGLIGNGGLKKQRTSACIIDLLLQII